VSIPTLEQAKTHLRQIDSDLDTAIGIAISGAQAEMDGYLGGEPTATRWPAEAAVPGDVLAAALTLTAVHFEAGTPDDAERRRKAAYALLAKHRTDAGIRGA